MPDPISSTIIGSLIKGLLDIATKQLPELLKSKTPPYATGQRFQELLYDLHAQLGLLNKEIGQLIEVFDLLLLDPTNYQQASHQLEPVLIDIRRTLATIELDLRSLRPGLEIHASDIVPLVDILSRHEGLLVGRIGLSGNLWRHDKNSVAYENELANYKSELKKMRGMAAETQEALDEAARQVYRVR